MLNITRLKVWFILDTLPSNAIIGFRVVILCTYFRLILTSSISIRMQKYAIKKDRLVCSSCNSQIKGAAVKAGGNFWHKVFIMKQGIYFVKNMFSKCWAKRKNKITQFSIRCRSIFVALIAGYVCDFQNRLKKILQCFRKMESCTVRLTTRKILYPGAHFAQDS